MYCKGNGFRKPKPEPNAEGEIHGTRRLGVCSSQEFTCQGWQIPCSLPQDKGQTMPLLEPTQTSARLLAHPSSNCLTLAFLFVLNIQRVIFNTVLHWLFSLFSHGFFHMTLRRINYIIKRNRINCKLTTRRTGQLLHHKDVNDRVGRGLFFSPAPSIEQDILLH